MASEISRRVFWLLNTFFMAPMFRLGFGPFMGNPVTGYIMLLRTLGRRTKKQRYTPVNYAIIKGNIYCLSGWGSVSDWYRNLRANPELEVILPGGALFGIAGEVTDPQERLSAIRQMLKNAGLVGFFAGLNPFTATDDEISRKIGALPLLRIRPAGIGNSPFDPGGWAWIGAISGAAVIIVLLVLLLSK
jgi:deazaflavin-dependent oxidoreductase (nitroreductase family)